MRTIFSGGSYSSRSLQSSNESQRSFLMRAAPTGAAVFSRSCLFTDSAQPGHLMRTALTLVVCPDKEISYPPSRSRDRVTMSFALKGSDESASVVLQTCPLL